ncbi:DUF4159 domain-containing protein [Candidatus Latescibacterota bacterium]
MRQETKSSRFVGITDIIDLKKLERETNRLILLGIVVGVAFHLAMGAYITFMKTEPVVVKPLTVELIIRQPRRNNPFKVQNKTPFPRQIPGKVFTPITHIPDLPAHLQPQTNVIPKYTDLADTFHIEYEPKLSLESVTYDSEQFVPAEYYYIEPFDRFHERMFSLQDNMLSVKDFMPITEGRKKGLVFYNPLDKLTIRGVISIPRIWNFKQYPAENLSIGIESLLDALNTYTDIISPVNKNNIRNVSIYQNTSFNFPFVYIGCSGLWEYLPFEAKAMGDYLRNGGFAVLENLRPWLEYSPAEASLRKFIKDSLGQDAVFQIIPNDHQLYHSFFDFIDGPPLGTERSVLVGQIMSNARPYLEGIWIGERLVVIFSNKGYANKWAARTNNEPQLRMGINMVIFALMQSGGKSDKRIDYALTPGIKVKRWKWNIKLPRSYGKYH